MKCNLCIAIGIGVIISALLMGLSSSITTDFRVEQKARELGMIYPSESKVLKK